MKYNPFYTKTLRYRQTLFHAIVRCPCNQRIIGKHRYIQKSPMQGTIAWHSGHLFILRYHCIQLFCIIQQLRDKKSLYSNPRFSRSASFVYEESSALSGMISIFLHLMLHAPPLFRSLHRQILRSTCPSKELLRLLPLPHGL